MQTFIINTGASFEDMSDNSLVVTQNGQPVAITPPSNVTTPHALVYMDDSYSFAPLEVSDPGLNAPTSGNYFLTIDKFSVQYTLASTKDSVILGDLTYGKITPTQMSIDSANVLNGASVMAVNSSNQFVQIAPQETLMY